MNFRTILGAISVYVMLGILFTRVYVAVTSSSPGCSSASLLQVGDYVFFSITTPDDRLRQPRPGRASPERCSRASEMLVGQIFLVTLIAGLVSLWRPGAGARSVAACADPG